MTLTFVLPIPIHNAIHNSIQNLAVYPFTIVQLYRINGFTGWIFNTEEYIAHCITLGKAPITR